MSSRYDDLIDHTENRANPMPGYISNLEDTISMTIVDTDKWKELIKILKFQSLATDALAKDVRTALKTEEAVDLVTELETDCRTLWENNTKSLSQTLTAASTEAGKQVENQMKNFSLQAGSLNERYSYYIAELSNTINSLKLKLILVLVTVPTVIDLLFLMLYTWWVHSQH